MEIIDQKTFITIIESIKEQDEIDNKVSKALELVCDSWVMFNTINKKYSALSLLLKEVFKDKGDWISWWLYEDVDKKVTYEDGREVDLSTPEELYKFLLENLNTCTTNSASNP